MTTMKALAPAGIAALLLAAPDAEAAAQICGERNQILKRMETAHSEVVEGIGLMADGGILELLVSPDGGWTMIVSYPKRPSCIVATGKAWQTIPVMLGDPA